MTLDEPNDPADIWPNDAPDTATNNRRGTYSRVTEDIRRTLVRLVYDQGTTVTESSNILQIKYSTAKTIIANYNKTGTVDRLPKGGSQRSILTPAIITEIENIFSFNPSLTLVQSKRILEERHGGDFNISTSTINRALQELKITMKLSHRELDRVNAPEKIVLRKAYAIWFNNHFPNNDYSTAVFIDESSFNLHLQRSQARSTRGTRAIVRVPTVRGRSISLLASMTINGISHCKTISNSTVNASIFSSYIFELCTYLRETLHMRNACLILDNARIHRLYDIQRTTAEFGYEYKFLSPYSYMLNPIENAFSKIKLEIRARLHIGETRSLSDLMLEEMRNVTPTDCVGYFRYILRNITNCAAELPYVHH